MWIGTDSEENERIQLERVISSTRSIGLQALPMIVFSDCVFPKFRECPRIGHLPQRTVRPGYLVEVRE